MNDRQFKTAKGAIRYAAKVARFRPGRFWVVKREILGDTTYTFTDCWSDGWTRSEIIWTNK